MKQIELPLRAELGSIYCTTDGAMCRNHNIVAANGELLATTKFKDVAAMIVTFYNAYGPMVEALEKAVTELLDLGVYHLATTPSLIVVDILETNKKIIQGLLAALAKAQLPDTDSGTSDTESGSAQEENSDE